MQRGQTISYTGYSSVPTQAGRLLTDFVPAVAAELIEGKQIRSLPVQASLESKESPELLGGRIGQIGGHVENEGARGDDGRRRSTGRTSSPLEVTPTLDLPICSRPMISVSPSAQAQDINSV